MLGSFDVFFSYSTRDHAAVERIAHALIEYGISVFLDRWYLTPGQPWPQALEQRLDACNAVAVFMGAEGLGPWQQRERDLALDRQGREPGFPVIPVLLTRADPALGFLKLNTWVDFSGGTTDSEALAILAAAIRGESPGPLARQRSEALRAAVCPYRGLQPFREEDEPFFFGRSSFAETLTATVLRRPFVAVVGASGSGKSSVVRAGLIPRLRRGAGNFVWDAVTLVPTDRPLISLSAALLLLLEPDLSEVKRLAEVADLANQLQAGRIELRDVAARVLAKQPGTERLLLFVDQWEEVHTLGHDADVRQAFIGQLLKAAASDAVRVVLTIRGDFMGRVLENRELSDRLQEGVVTIGPMTRDELAETIVHPASKVGLRFEAGLPETILDDLGDEPGSLPLLEFLLEGLWAQRRGGLLTHGAYVGLGRVSGAIAHRAEDVFEYGLNEAERQAAQRLLMRMVRPGEGVEDTRRRATVPDADAVADATVQKLAKERLVVTERDVGSGQVTVEVAHEALIRRWQRLRDWIDADREFLRTRERIIAQAELWDKEKRLTDRLLQPGRPLAEGEDLLARHRADLELLLVEYIEASAAAARASVKRRRRRTRAFMVAMAIVTFIAFSGGVIALWQSGEAERNAGQAQRNAEQAQRNAEQAQRNQSRALDALARIEVEKGSPASALRVALAAVPQSIEARDRIYAATQVEATIWNALHSLRELRRCRGHEKEVNSVAFSPDGRFLATGSEDHTARLWEVATGKEKTVFRGHEREVTSVAFSPDGRFLATGSEDHTARLWEVVTEKEVLAFRGHEWEVTSIAFSPDGKLLVTGSSDGSRLWEVASGKQIAAVDIYSVSSVAFSPDGKLLATSYWDKTAQLWEVATGKEVGVLRGHEGEVTSVAFSPDGKFLATGSEDQTARLWEVPTRMEITAFRGHEDEVVSVAFSPDGKHLATGSKDKTARLWEVARGQEIAAFRGHEKEIASVAFSPDGKFLATGSKDKTVRLWEAATEKHLTVFRGHEKEVHSVAVSPDGKLLATGSEDQTARLWEVATGKKIAVFPDLGGGSPVAFSPDGRLLAMGSWKKVRLWDVAAEAEKEIAAVGIHSVSSVAFSPDGKLLATSYWDKTAQLWEVATGKEVGVLRGHEGEVTSVAFSPDGKFLATGSNDETVRLWEVATGKEITTFRLYFVTSVAFSPDGRLLAMGSWDKTARLWEVATKKEIADFRGHKDYVNSVAFSPAGELLATGSMDGTARIWEVATGKQINAFHFEAAVSSVAFTPDGNFLATASADKTARLSPVGGPLVDLACARVLELPFSAQDKSRFGIDDEWCTPEVSDALRTKLGLEKSPAESAPADAATVGAH